MGSSVEEILTHYLAWERVKNQQGYSEELRLAYDHDAKFYLASGLPAETALHGDTIFSFWTPYKRLLKLFAGWEAYRTQRSLERLLRQMKSTKPNAYTANMLAANDAIDPFAQVVYSKGNYMLLPNRQMNRVRYEIAEDRIDLTLDQCFSGGALSRFFENDDALRRWIRAERLDFLFSDGILDREHLLWLVPGETPISQMDENELACYLDCAVRFIREREKKTP